MLTPRTSFVSSQDHVEVAVHDYGGDGHPTIFIHGTGLVSRMWEPVITRLGEEFRAICVDLRGDFLDVRREPYPVTSMYAELRAL